ncbi:MAG: 16S rRNA (uracil(1498)-N(3))-methyltransferase [Saprospiraceae bacterium]|nr:16S rRNA (uracil(1498)-N(3))-methyltransferase [Saprospiraceae bacterium]
MALFYSADITSDLITLKGDDHIHSVKSLRSKKGDHLNVTDGKGQLFSVIIEEISKNETKCKILEKSFQSPLDPKTAIAISPTKNAARIEWFLEKAVEIGISEIIIFISKRTEKKHFNADRANKIMISAMKQSGNIHLPALHIFSKIIDYVRHSSDYNQKFIAHCENPDQHLLKIMQPEKSAITWIGPEGDFTPDEIKQAEENGYVSVSLGKSRLRTETAGIVALSWMNSMK